ncbi:MAG: glycosyltransferase family A protein, partial [Nitrososphaerales archaeon]
LNRSFIVDEYGIVHKILPNTLQSIANNSNVGRLEVIISDWGSTDWPLKEWVPKILSGIDYKIIQVNGSFSRGRGRNIAAEYASSDTIFFLDADVKPSKQALELAINKPKENICVFPKCRILTRNGIPKHTGRVWAKGYGVCAVKKKWWIDVGKWPEYIKWGAEDNLFHARINEYHIEHPDIIRDIIRPEIYDLQHQWHPHNRK